LSITKKVLAKNISQKLGLSQKDSLFFVQNFFNALTNNRNSVININNFGTFSYKKTPKRIGRNPKTLEEFEIKPREKLTFQLSDKIKKNIN
tara:strand:- start:36 stop:308 length:273 start_codon:yes stop_codon:yes gene_type:complete